MASVLPRGAGSNLQESPLPPLREGERLTRAEFHERYEAMAPNTRAELIGGVVSMPSPARLRHGRPQARVVGWLEAYIMATPGVDTADNASVFLSDVDEPQPDASLFTLPEYGGQVRIEDDYLVGSPELIVEVAASSARYDLREKKTAYEQAGAREYVVVLVDERQVAWFVRRGESFQELTAGEDGLYRSQVFPGLWLDPEALLRLDSRGIRAALAKGLASQEHRKFVDHLEKVKEATAEE